MADWDTEEKIYRALALMHSTEKKSAEKLRMMLDSFIARKFGPEQTLVSRIPRNFLKKVETCQQIPQAFSEVNSASGDVEDFLPKRMMDEVSMKSINIFTSESDDSTDVDEVPRISIPDEGSGDGALCLVFFCFFLEFIFPVNKILIALGLKYEWITADGATFALIYPRARTNPTAVTNLYKVTDICANVAPPAVIYCYFEPKPIFLEKFLLYWKVCNGSNLGPFILLECHNCEEVYHPLCHQPPVLGIDIYDPELVWFCGSCNENADQKKNLDIYSKKEGIKRKSLDGTRKNKSQNRKRKIEEA